MEKASRDIKGQKTRISKLAIASVLIPLFLCIGCFCFILANQGKLSENLGNLHPYLFIFPIVAYFLTPLAFLLSLLSLIKIKKSRGLLKGYIFGCIGLLLSVFSLHCGLVAVGSVRPESRTQFCKRKMMYLAEALRSYSNDYDGKYPTPDKWCDLLVECKEFPKDYLICPREKRGVEGGYAINPNATPKSASDVVLVFDTECVWERCWNRFGGAEILTFENHRRATLLPHKRVFGVGCCNILFNDGSVELIYPEQLSDLNWGDEQKE